MALIGLYLLCITDGFSIGLGDVLVLVCAFLFSLHILVIDYFSPKADGVKLSCIQFLVCGILSMIPALVLEHPQISSILTAWLPILYAGIMSCGVAYTLQIVGQKNVNPTVASLILSLESCISVLAGWVILGQKLSAKSFLDASSCSRLSSWHSCRRNLLRNRQINNKVHEKLSRFSCTSFYLSLAFTAAPCGYWPVTSFTPLLLRLS